VNKRANDHQPSEREQNVALIQKHQMKMEEMEFDQNQQQRHSEQSERMVGKLTRLNQPDEGHKQIWCWDET
jgi:hypothetical protein